jgi:chemotaxis protein histidine kinase CheA
MTDSMDDPRSGTIDPEAMRQAEAVIEQLRWVYIREWAPAAILEIEQSVQAIDRCVRAGATKDEAEAYIDALVRLTHDMKGQAGTFGLDLLQDFAASLHDFVRASDSLGAREADVFTAHASAMRSVLNDVSSNPDGALDEESEQRLREGLRRLAGLRFN